MDSNNRFYKPKAFEPFSLLIASIKTKAFIPNFPLRFSYSCSIKYLAHSQVFY